MLFEHWLNPEYVCLKLLNYVLYINTFPSIVSAKHTVS